MHNGMRNSRYMDHPFPHENKSLKDYTKESESEKTPEWVYALSRGKCEAEDEKCSTAAVSLPPRKQLLTLSLSLALDGKDHGRWANK